MNEEIILKLDWTKAKSLQVAIALAKQHIKEGSITMKDLEGIESILEILLRQHYQSLMLRGS